jgi:hypothetical protein
MPTVDSTMAQNHYLARSILRKWHGSVVRVWKICRSRNPHESDGDSSCLVLFRGRVGWTGGPLKPVFGLSGIADRWPGSPRCGFSHEGCPGSRGIRDLGTDGTVNHDFDSGPISRFWLEWGSSVFETRISRSELTQMMIRVKVGQAPPVRRGHLSQVRMRRRTMKIFRLTSKPVDQSVQGADILVKHCRPGSASLLVQFWRSLESPEPGDRSPQRRPLQQNPRIRNRYRAHRHQPHVQPERIRQVTDHLVSRHLSPTALARGGDRLKASEEFCLICGIE